MEYGTLIATLKELAPLELAESWDNVGVLLQPTNVTNKTAIAAVFMTIDLTEEVLEEAIAFKQESSPQQPLLLVAYHPPLFTSFKRLTSSDPKQRIAIRCIEHSIAIYSPHSALDGVEGGINDWLAEGLGEAKEVRPITPAMTLPTSNQTHKVALTFSSNSSSSAEEEATSNTLKEELGLEAVDHLPSSEPGQRRLEFFVNKSTLSKLSDVLDRLFKGKELPRWEVYALSEVPKPSTGTGRLVTLKEAVPLPTMIERIKKHLNLPFLRVGASRKHAPKKEGAGESSSGGDHIRTIAICAGSGASVVRGARADLVLTGEMSHHEVLAAMAKGTSVVLSEHSNSERGYLPVFKKRLEEKVKMACSPTDHPIKIHVSSVDCDPLVVL
ncbi:NGG1 interacting factor [Balamuthia mandrillaris]